MKKAILFALASCALAGCAPQNQGFWRNPDISTAQAQSVAYDCSVTARGMHRGRSLVQEVHAQQEFNNCMQARGFVWVSTP